MASGDTAATNTLLPLGPGASNSLEFESLRDVVEQLWKDDVPFYSNLTKVDAMAIREDWGTEDIGTVTVADHRKIGFVAAATAEVADRRLVNYCQLIAEQGSLSDTKRRVKQADGTNTLEHRKLKRSKLMMRRMNMMLHTPQAYTASMSDPVMATFHCYTVANFLSVAGTPGATPTGDGTDAPGSGTSPVAFDSIDPIDDVLQASAATRGTPQAMYLSLRNKRLFSRLPDASIGELRSNKDNGQESPFMFVGTADTYLSDFGLIETIPDLDAPSSGIEIIDHDYMDLAVLPGLDFDEKDMGARGSSTEFIIQWQGTLRNLLPEAHAYVNGFTTTG